MERLSGDPGMASVALVTGAARGMGLATVGQLVRAGFSTVAVDLDGVAFSELEGEVETIVADVTDEAAVARMARAVVDRHGRLDVLVNNAGGALSGRHLSDTSLEDWERTLRLNLTSQFLCIRAVLPAMMAQRSGRIINIASTAVFSGMTAPFYAGEAASNLVAYVAAKGGVVALTRALARELGPFNITVNAVAPGFTPTPRVRAVVPPHAIARMVEDQALRRVQEAGDTSATVVFLASPGAAFITGQVIRVDGGASMG